MKKLITLMAAVGAVALMAPAASAQEGRDRGGYENSDRYDRDREDGRYEDRDRSDGERDYDRGDYRRGGRDLGHQVDARQWQIENQINVGLRQGALSRREARGLRGEFYRIASLEERYRSGGLTNREAADLNRRLDWLSRSVRAERNDRNNSFG